MAIMNENKLKVLIGAIAVSIIAIIAWTMKLKYKKSIGAGLLALITGVAICFWVWYAKLPNFKDTEKTFSQSDCVNCSFDTITKGDLK